MADQQPQTIAAFLLENGAAARRLLEAVQKVDEVDDNVKVVDAAIAERTKLRGRVKVHQTEDMGAMKGGFHGAAIGVVVGRPHRGSGRGRRRRRGRRAAPQPAQPLPRHRDRRQVDAAGLQGDREGQERPLRPVRGQLGRLDRLDRERDQGRERPAHPEHAAARDGVALRALVEPAAESLGGEEVVADFEVEVEEAPEEAAPRKLPAAEEAAPVAVAAAATEASNGHAAGDDLTQLVGIGPKAAAALAAAGITTYAALAEANEPQLRHALHEADMMPPGNVATWPMQASYATKGDWQGLMKHNEKAMAGRPSPQRPPTATAVAAPPDDLTQLNGIGPRI